MSTTITTRGDSIVIEADETSTWLWATKPGASWPCSVLRNKPVQATFDRTGLVELWIPEGEDVSNDELTAFCTDTARDHGLDQSWIDVITGGKQ